MKRPLLILMLTAAMLAPVVSEVAQGGQPSPPVGNTQQPPQPANGKGGDNQPARQEHLGPAPQKSESDAALEEKKLDIERQKLAVERAKIPWTAVSTVVPLLGVLLTVAYSVWSFRKQSQQQAEQRREDAKRIEEQRREDAKRIEEQRMADAKLQFELKAAEIAFEGETPLAVQHRAGALKAIFGEWLPDNFLDSYDPYEFGQNKFGQNEGNPDSKKFLLELLLQHPDRQLEIVLFWKQLFPGDVGWLNNLNNLTPGRLQITRKAGEGQSTSQPNVTASQIPVGTATATPPAKDDSPGGENIQT